MTIDELNVLSASGEMDEFIRVAEARQVKALSQVADRVCARDGVRLVLLAGASSAGKTTTAKRLSTQLRVNGRAAMHLSTDDYFVGDALNPRDENGELDYEHVDCVDKVRLAEDMNRLFAGEKIRRRRFDFVKHAPFDSEEQLTLPAGGIVVIEGIHALNPVLTAGIDDAAKFRLFIDPKPELGLFLSPCLSASDNRLLRRLVRDNQFRKLSPLDTFRLWPKVLAGEEKWIRPFAPLADAVFDSSLAYELAVLRPYVEGLLERVVQKEPQHAKATMLLKLLRMVEPFSPATVPGDSILRETIGGSQLEY